LLYDRSENTGDACSEHEVREADLLTSPEDFLRGRRRIAREEGQRVRGPNGGGIRVGADARLTSSVLLDDMIRRMVGVMS
jgi:hypothetical protein